MLAFSTSGRSYRYYVFIRSLYGINSVPERTSLCPFVQTMIWLTIASWVMSPLIVIGWVGLKLMRTAYKVIAATPFTQPFAIWLDGRKIMEALDSAPNDIAEAPIPYLSIVGLTISVFVGFLVLAVCLCQLGIMGFIHILPEIPRAILNAALWTGTGIFHCFSGIAWCVIVAVQTIISVIEYLAHRIASFFLSPETHHFLLFFVFYATILLILTYLFYLFSQTKVYERLNDRLSFKINGFGKARATIKAAKIAKAETPPVVRAPKWFSKFLDWLRSLNVSRVEVKGYTHTLVGPIGIVWLWIKALKQRACPIVTFVDPADIKQSQG